MAFAATREWVAHELGAHCNGEDGFLDAFRALAVEAKPDDGGRRKARRAARWAKRDAPMCQLNGEVLLVGDSRGVLFGVISIVKTLLRK
jgi:hypothetical protein